MDGEQNPADLFTKHMITRDKMAGLVRMLGCHYRGGRAETAPLTRTTPTGRTTMAEADTNAIEINNTMPHLAHSPEELDRKFPAMNAPQDIEDDKEDMWSTWDGIAQRGEEIIREVVARMTRDGRRRCEDPSTTSTTTTTTATTTTTSCAQMDNEAVAREA